MDRFNVNASLSRNWEHLENKFVGTGHPDMTRHQWAANHHRDTFASILGHYDLLSYIAVAENNAIGRVKFNMLEKMIQPVGPPPATNSAVVVTTESAVAAETNAKNATTTTTASTLTATTASSGMNVEENAGGRIGAGAGGR